MSIITLVVVPVVGTLALVFIGVGVVVYSRLVRAQRLMDEAWSEVEARLYRRRELVPALAERVSEYTQQEAALLDEITQCRHRCREVGDLKEKGGLETVLSHQLRKLFALERSYPELMADSEFLVLQEKLAGTENQIERTTAFYNKSVREYNARLKTSLGSLFAEHFDFRREDSFQMEYATQTMGESGAAGG